MRIFTVYLQGFLWFIGIAIHNEYTDECTPDFNCCNKNIGRRCFTRIPDILTQHKAYLDKLNRLDSKIE